MYGIKWIYIYEVKCKSIIVLLILKISININCMFNVFVCVLLFIVCDIVYKFKKRYIYVWLKSVKSIIII